MRPSICLFIFNTFYAGRLIDHKSIIDHSLNVQGINLPNDGIVVISDDGERCSQKKTRSLKSKYQARGDISLTYFKLVTLAIDIAILEVGIGSWLDAVNLFDGNIALSP